MYGLKQLVFALSLCVATAAAADEAIYNSKCKGCHGADGAAKTKVGIKEKVPDMSTPDWQSRHSDAQIRKVIEEGSTENSKMKPFKDKLTPEQIDSLVAYIRGLKKG